MTLPSDQSISRIPGRIKLPAGARWPDISFRWLALLAAVTIGVLIVLVGWELYQGSRLAIAQFGPKFLVTSTWNPVTDQYGAWPFIYGTLVSSIIALVIAVPLGVATALYLTELAPNRIRQPVIMVVEMLAAVPSVIFGLWGIFVLIPWLRDHLFVWLKNTLGFVPLF
jgi:phosphate transport system permease protein